MANEIPQIQDSQPVLSPVNVNSKASGYEEFAKTLGNLGEKAEAKTEEMASDQSQAMYINSVANIEQIKTKAQISMLEHPDQSIKIAQQTNTALEAVSQNAFVNKKDRLRLKSDVNSATNDMALKSATTEVKQRQLESAFTHYANWPDQLKAYKSALMNDHVKAESLKNAMISSLHSLVSTGSMTPIQAANQMKTMQDVVGLAQQHYEMYGSGETTAKDYHTLTSNPLDQQADDSTAPINHSTGWMINYYNNDKSFQGVLADISQRRLPNPEVFDSLEPAQRDHALMAMHGTQVADGMIKSGEPYSSLEHTFKSLDETGRVLSYKDQATKNALGTYLAELKNGNYLNIMGQTPAGNAIMRDFVTRDSAIRNTPIADDQKGQLLLQNKNQMVSASIAYADAHHIPRQYVQPIPQADVAQVQNAFALGQDPSSVLSTLGQYTKQNQAYLANAMKDPGQRMIVQTAALSGGDVPYQDQVDFIAGNQTGRGYPTGIKGEIPDNTLKARIYANLKEPMRIIAQNYDPQQAQTLQNAMLTTTLNAAKYYAMKDNNQTMETKGFNIFGTASGWEMYVDKAAKFYNSSYTQKSGSNWIVNPKQLPAPMSNGDLDNLAHYAITQGNDYVSSHLGDERYNQMAGRGSLKMIITPTQDIQAVTPNGEVVFSTPYTDNLIPHAVSENKKRAAMDAEQLKKMVGESNERNARRMLNVRLPDNANPQ